ncbi:DEKNAAC104697 [Brettanomyces naardenensis]|uniref:DEKNAAC104697 n=1 Tax=Brettanomyces naardenensis TaxID=13370 RepID=A0A448YQZ6_BRENA|nr:DEKNAAC104697 [Brettanomyces naardenensis]
MFTPAESSLGALFIQSATGSYMEIEGKPVGFSSIIYNSVFHPTIHSVSIVLGALLSGSFVKRFLPTFQPEYALSSDNHPLVLGSVSNYCTSGLLIGLGSSLGKGCTSGHMIAGISRLRWRSIVATLVFATTAVITSTVLDNGISCGAGLSCSSYDDKFTIFNANKSLLLKLLAAGFAESYIVLPLVLKKVKESGNETWITIGKFLTGLSTGFQFGLGLLISGMASSAKVLGFLSVFSKEKFDPSLLAIPLFTILPNILTWRSQVPQDVTELATKKPVLEDSFDLNFDDTIDAPFILGNVIFGVGWGISGICPATGLLGLVFNYTNGAYWLASFLGGYFAGKQLQNIDWNSQSTSSSSSTSTPALH